MRAVAQLVIGVLALFMFAAPANAERVVIDSVGVNAPVVNVGLRGGALDLGNDLWTAYTWRAGVRPCSPGSFAVAVHAYEVPGGRALGNRVRGLKSGTRIRIERPGKDCTYRVTTATTVGARANLSSCYSFDGRARGCIITCVGRTGPGQYTHRRVIRFVRTR